MGKEAVLFRSPYRWALLFLAWFGALAILLTATKTTGAPTLGMVLGGLLAWFAAFGRRRSTRYLLSTVLILTGVAALGASRVPWAGTLMLISGTGLLGNAMSGPDAAGIRRHSREWIHAHALPPAEVHLPPDAAPPAVARNDPVPAESAELARARLEIPASLVHRRILRTVDGLRIEASLHRSFFGWVLVSLAWIGAALCALAATFGGDEVAFLGAIAGLAAGAAAFHPRRGLRFAASLFVAIAGVVVHVYGSVAPGGIFVLAGGVGLLGHAFEGPSTSSLRSPRGSRSAQEPAARPEPTSRSR